MILFAQLSTLTAIIWLAQKPFLVTGYYNNGFTKNTIDDHMVAKSVHENSMN